MPQQHNIKPATSGAGYFFKACSLRLNQVRAVLFSSRY